MEAKNSEEEFVDTTTMMENTRQDATTLEENHSVSENITVNNEGDHGDSGGGCNLVSSHGGGDYGGSSSGGGGYGGSSYGGGDYGGSSYGGGDYGGSSSGGGDYGGGDCGGGD